jgi:hypothetical protein
MALMQAQMLSLQANMAKKAKKNSSKTKKRPTKRVKKEEDVDGDMLKVKQEK